MSSQSKPFSLAEDWKRFTARMALYLACVVVFVVAVSVITLYNSYDRAGDLKVSFSDQRLREIASDPELARNFDIALLRQCVLDKDKCQDLRRADVIKRWQNLRPELEIDAFIKK